MRWPASPPGDAIHVLGPLGSGFDLTVERPLLVGGGIGIAPLPYLSERLGGPPALLGFRSAHHAEAAALVPGAEVVLDPTLVTEALPPDPGDVLACGPEPMLRAAGTTRAERPAGLGSPDGLRVRRVLRLRGGDRGALPAPLRGRAGRPRPRGDRAWLAPSVPILNASGCLDALTAPDVARSLDAFVTKTVTPEPREGNPPVRIAETEHGMLNSIGLQGPGLDGLLERLLPALAPLGVPIWVSVGGFSARDYAASCERLDERDDVATVELNLSCPNVEEAPETAAEIVAAARAVTTKPLYAKLSPATWDVAESARACVAAGADGLSLVNTIRGLALEPRTLRPSLGTRRGWLLGAGAPPDRSRLRLRLRRGGRRAHRRAWVGWRREPTRSTSSRRVRPPSRSAPCSSPTRVLPAGSGPSWRPRLAREGSNLRTSSTEPRCPV